MKNIYTFLISLVLCTPLYAQATANTDLPMYCHDEGYAFIDETVTLGDEQKLSTDPVVYLLQNTSASKIWLNHEVENKSASAGWATELAVGMWTALALNERPFNLNCVEVRPGAEQVIPCQSVLKICQLRRLSFAKSSEGSYWAAENLPLEQVFDALEKRGISINSK